MIKRLRKERGTYTMEHFGKIIDFHVHPYLSEEDYLCQYKESLALTAEEAKEDLLKAGIGKICGSVINRDKTKPEQGFAPLKALNEKALEVKKVYGDFYVPGFHIHPGFVKESLETIEWMHQNGYRLIGEIVPYYHAWGDMGLDYGCKELMEILDLAGQYDMIFSYHTMPDWAEQMEKMIAQNPKVTFVAAHPGEKVNFVKHIERMKKYENAYLDISGTGLFRYGMLKQGVEQAGDDRILFATDYPITNPWMYVEAVDFEHISEESKEKIFYKNAQRILGL